MEQTLSVHETTYYNRLKSIYHEGTNDINERTGVGTIKTIGTLDKYHMVDGIPLLQLRKINPDVPIREMRWFLRGDTNIKTLGAKIWDTWADENGELGPIYGAQWRNLNWIELVDASTYPSEAYLVQDYANDGIEAQCLGSMVDATDNVAKLIIQCKADQFDNMLKLLKESPTDRCNIVNAYNVADLRKMALRPCHTMFAVNTREATGREKAMFGKDVAVDLDLFQRSCDYPVGGYFNIYQYSALLCAIADKTGYAAGCFNHHVVNNHIYADQIEGVKEILANGIGEHVPMYMRFNGNSPIEDMDYTLIGDYKPALQSVNLPVTA